MKSFSEYVIKNQEIVTEDLSNGNLNELEKFMKTMLKDIKSLKVYDEEHADLFLRELKDFIYEIDEFKYVLNRAKEDMVKRYKYIDSRL